MLSLDKLADCRKVLRLRILLLQLGQFINLNIILIHEY